MDYLLRDAYHAGVNYGRFDLDRVVATISLCEDPEESGYFIGVSEDGFHAVEGLLIARYMMFTQLYFHHTRSIYDFHLAECLKLLLKDSSGMFPPATKQGIRKFLEWDDWRVLGQIAINKAGRHGSILRSRNHFRRIFETSEVASEEEIESANSKYEKLKDFHPVLQKSTKSWYKFRSEEIYVKSIIGGRKGTSVPLSTLSTVVRGLQTINQIRIYVQNEKRERAVQLIS